MVSYKTYVSKKLVTAYVSSDLTKWMALSVCMLS